MVLWLLLAALLASLRGLGGWSLQRDTRFLLSLSGLLLLLAALLLPPSLRGLGGWSLQRDTRFLLCAGFVSPSRSLDLERERLRRRPVCLSASRLLGPSKFLAALRSRRGEKRVIKRRFDYKYIINFNIFQTTVTLFEQNVYPSSELVPQKLGISISSSFMAAAATCASSFSGWHGGI